MENKIFFFFFFFLPLLTFRTTLCTQWNVLTHSHTSDVNP